MNYKEYVAKNLKIDGVSENEILELISLPPDNSMGDYALPCFKFAKVLRKSPVMIAEELSKTFPVGDVIVKVTPVNGYLNFMVNRSV